MISISALHVLASTTLASAQGSPTTLIVLQHGLYGSAASMRTIEAAITRQFGGQAIVHCCTANEGLQTRDGVAAGGRRLAADVRKIAARCSTLRTVSLVGFSLGGLYARYAAAELLDRDGRLAGLTPDALVTVACPHLGVRRFTYLPLPSWVRCLGWWVAGQTAVELLLQDGRHGHLLVALGTAGGRYGAALRAFRRRRLYANLRGDYMAPFGTAAIAINESRKGSWGAGVWDGRLAAAFGARPGAVVLDPGVIEGTAPGIGAICMEGGGLPAPEGEAGTTATADPEAAMLAGLHACRWSKVACSWRSRAGLVTRARAVCERAEGWPAALGLALEGAHGELRTSAAMVDAARYLWSDGACLSSVL